VRRVHRDEPTVSIATEQHAVARVVASLGRRHAEEVAAEQEIDVPVVIEVGGDDGVDGRELRLDWQRLEGEVALSIIPRDRTGEGVRLERACGL